MNALEELIVLAFILNVLIGCFLYYAVLVKGFNNQPNALLFVIALVVAAVTGLLAAPIMTLFMGPFLCLGAVLLYFALRSLLAENSPSNFLKSLQQKTLPQLSPVAYTWLCFFCLSGIILLLLLALYPFNE
jgi:hypothetical protein